MLRAQCPHEQKQIKYNKCARDSARLAEISPKTIIKLGGETVRLQLIKNYKDTRM